MLGKGKKIMTHQNLYRLWDSDDQLLYVGISKSAINRIADHLQNQPWASAIATMTIEHFTDRAAVEKAERLAIAKENPLHNKQRYTINNVPVEDLWGIMSVNERRMTGQVLYNLSNQMNDDDLDNEIIMKDENYQTLCKLLRTVGRWFMEDFQPDEMVINLFNHTQRSRFEGIRKAEHVDDLHSLRSECKQLKREIKELKAVIND